MDAIKAFARQSNWSTNRTQKVSKQTALSPDLVDALSTATKSIRDAKHNQAPDTAHPFVYPERDSVECLIHQTCNVDAVSSHDNRAMFLMLRELAHLRQSRCNVMLPFAYYAFDFEHEEGKAKTAASFRSHIRSLASPGRSNILLLECARCGNGDTSLFDRKGGWGHRTLVIFQYDPNQGMFGVEYYDSLGDQSMDRTFQGTKDGVMASHYLLKYLIEPMSSDVVRVPETTTYESEIGPLNPSEAKYPKEIRPFSLYFQHRKEYMCQNWVLFFADAHMAGFTAKHWLQLCVHPELTHFNPKSRDPELRHRTSFDTDFTLMVLFHFFHLRRLLKAHHVMTRLTQKEIQYAHQKKELSMNEWFDSDRMVQSEFGMKQGTLQKDIYLNVFECSYRAMNDMSRRYAWMPEMPFPDDSVPLETVHHDPLQSLFYLYPELEVHTISGKLDNSAPAIVHDNVSQAIRI